MFIHVLSNEGLHVYLMVWGEDELKDNHQPNESGLGVKAECPVDHHFLGQKGEDHKTQEHVQLQS